MTREQVTAILEKHLEPRFANGTVELVITKPMTYKQLIEDLTLPDKNLSLGG